MTTIKNFKVLDTTTSGNTAGIMLISGRKTTDELNNISSQYNLKNNLINLIPVSGTPSSINNSNFKNIAHMGSSYIKISTNGMDNPSDENINIFHKIRIIFYFGSSSSQNMICYGWANKLTQTVTEYNVLFANCNAQSYGDYVDIDLPDRTFYPKLYLVLILINNIWSSRIIEDIPTKTCSVDISNWDYFNLNPSKSNTNNYDGIDNNTSHTIIIKGKDQANNKNIRICIAFEDWYIDITDKDYYDVGLIITDAINDELNINDTNLS
jgi:hypothetical protein